MPNHSRGKGFVGYTQPYLPQQKKGGGGKKRAKSDVQCSCGRPHGDHATPQSLVAADATQEKSALAQQPRFGQEGMLRKWVKQRMIAGLNGKILGGGEEEEAGRQAGKACAALLRT